MESTTIKVSIAVKNELSNLKIDNEGYSVVIKRLIEENKELKKDKAALLEALNKEINIVMKED